MSLDKTGRGSRDVWSPRIEAIARDQDRTAFAELFNHFAPRVKAFMRRKRGERPAGRGHRPGGDAGRLAQGVAVQSLRLGRRDLDLHHRPQPAHRRPAARTVGAARSGSRRSRPSTRSTKTPPADIRLAAAQSEARLREALKALPNEQLKVIEMSFFEEKAHSEIAETLRIPLGTVKSRARLAMKRLRALLETEQ